MDSTGTIMWGFTHDENISQVIQTSENEFVLLGTAYDTTILKMGFCLKNYETQFQ